VESVALGLPRLPGPDNPTSVTSLLTGSHTVRVWYDSTRRFRLAVPGTMSESDLVVNGGTAWYWQSSTNSVTRFTLPAGTDPAAHAPAMALTPQQAARQALAAVGPSTTVSVQSNVNVAGEAAYQLVLAPRSTSSLIGQVRIAVDATRNVPLRVQVFGRGATSPAFQVGYTSVSFVRPAATNFAFTPPPGAKVSTVTPGSAHPGKPNGTAPAVLGKDWLSVGVFPASDLAGLTGSSAAIGGAASSAARSAAGSGSGGSTDNAAIFGALMKSATAVHGPWGSGRLLHTSLLNVLITSNGKVLVGAVTPSVLYADAALAK
jgi:outer membrane lipoprotein-sorting protein